MRLVVAGGGTGGHLFPGVAVADELRRVDPASRVLFLGTPRGLEERVVPARGYELRIVDARPLKGGGVWGALRGLAAVPGAIRQARRMLREFEAEAALGVGGYAAGPALVAARGLGLPTAILEVNVVPGLTNRWLGRLVERVYVHFEESARSFSARKVLVTGTPLRSEFARPAPPPSQGEIVLVLGGSQGARTLNRVVPDALAEVGRGLPVVHQSGPGDADGVRGRYAVLGLRAEVVPFLEDVAGALGRARVVVCRAGAGTLAEVCAVGRPSVLVPYRYAANDHQSANARAIERAGGAVVLEDKNLNAETLAAALRPLLGDAALADRMGAAAHVLETTNAAFSIVADLGRLVRRVAPR